MPNFSIEDVYTISFFLKQEGGYSFEELGNLQSFEVEIFYFMLIDKIKREKKAIDDARKQK